MLKVLQNGRGNHAGENRKAVIGSPILAKAILKNEAGDVQILVVFSRSTTQEFYWVFRAKSVKSSRKSWKYVDHYMRNFSHVRPSYFDFGSLVAYHARLHKQTVISQRTPHKRKLAALLQKTEHFSIFGDWEPQVPANISTDYCRRRALNARSSRLAWR